MLASNRTRTLPYVGSAFAMLGIVLIILGWRGAANTSLVFEQLPYFISGGQLGTAFVTFGSLLYFSYWLTVITQDQRETHRLLEALLVQAQKPAADAPPVLPVLVGTLKGDMAHRPECSIVRGRPGVKPISDATGRKACGICRP